MDTESVNWLMNKIDSNAPERAGVEGAVRCLDAAANLANGGATAFGLALAQPVTGPEVEALRQALRDRLQPWLDAIDGDLRAQVVASVGGGDRLRAAGFELEPDEPPVILDRLVFSYDVSVEQGGGVHDEDPVTDGAVLAQLDGVEPEEHSQPSELLFERLDWLVSGDLELRFDPTDQRLRCDLYLEADQVLIDREVARAKRAVDELWQSSWAFNLDWALPSVEGWSDEHYPCVHIDDSSVRVRREA